MEEKLIENKAEQPAEVKKAYTPPTLTVYGKLTELTAGGTATRNENQPGGHGDPKEQRF
jgi:hypothetical protein